MPAIKEAMAQHQAEIDAIVNNQEEPTFENTVAAYDRAGELLGRINSVFPRSIVQIRTNNCRR